LSETTSWQAVAIVLINMIGSVAMAFLRESTNKARMRNGHKKDHPDAG
jgi:hypothetical protein